MQITVDRAEIIDVVSVYATEILDRFLVFLLLFLKAFVCAVKHWLVLHDSWVYIVLSSLPFIYINVRVVTLDNVIHN